MVGQWTLNPFILVRIQVPEPIIKHSAIGSVLLLFRGGTWIRTGKGENGSFLLLRKGWEI